MLLIADVAGALDTPPFRSGGPAASSLADEVCPEDAAALRHLLLVLDDGGAGQPRPVPAGDRSASDRGASRQKD